MEALFLVAVVGIAAIAGVFLLLMLAFKLLLWVVFLPIRLLCAVLFFPVWIIWKALRFTAWLALVPLIVIGTVIAGLVALIGGLLVALVPVLLLVGMVALVWVIVRSLMRPALA